MSHRPENDSELAEMVIRVQQLADSLNLVIRERGINGLANELANLAKATREAEWRCNEIMVKERLWPKILTGSLNTEILTNAVTGAE